MPREAGEVPAAEPGSGREGSSRTRGVMQESRQPCGTPSFRGAQTAPVRPCRHLPLLQPGSFAQTRSPHRGLAIAGCPGLEQDPCPSSPLPTLACLSPSLGNAHTHLQPPHTPRQRPGRPQRQTQRTVRLGVIRLLLLRGGIVFVVIILCGGERVCKRRDGPAEYPRVDPSLPEGDQAGTGASRAGGEGLYAGGGWGRAAWCTAGAAGVPAERCACPSAQPGLTVPAVPVPTARGRHEAMCPQR